MFSALSIEKLPDLYQGRVMWKLNKPLTYCLMGMTITVPEGFRTDFASVPWYFHWIFPPTGQYCEATVVHDFLYTQKKCSRVLADALFREAMKDSGVPFRKRFAMWLAVRTFGPRYKREQIC